MTTPTPPGRLASGLGTRLRALRGLSIGITRAVTGRTQIPYILTDAPDPATASLFNGHLFQGLFHWRGAQGWIATRSDGVPFVTGVPASIVWWIAITVIAVLGPSLRNLLVILAIGCFAFTVSDANVAYGGRLLQGVGSAFAFTGAVYLASHGFSAGDRVAQEPSVRAQQSAHPPNPRGG